jgi:1-acyl-sn-glycerol-3-phosphate acyltransferase
MIKAIFVWFCICSSALIVSLLCLATYPFDRQGRVIHRLAGFWSRVSLLACGVKVRLEGLERVPGGGPYIFMSNHQGSYDIFSLTAHLPFQFKWLAKKEIFSIPFLGWAMKTAGYISIDREGTRDTVEAMNKAARKIHDGMSVVIFPEGSRSPDGTIQPFKKGGFSLAVKSKVPIVPIALSGSREIMPRGRLVANSGVIRVRLDTPIETENCSAKDREMLMGKVKEAITRNFEIISKNGEEEPCPKIPSSRN